MGGGGGAPEAAAEGGESGGGTGFDGGLEEQALVAPNLHQSQAKLKVVGLNELNG
eukprot:COSAG04_NODE_234_length_19155_cov_812.438707_4_plen_55_part_00